MSATTLKTGLRTEVRQALVQQTARRMDDERVEETSEETVAKIIGKDLPAHNLLWAVYGQNNLNKLSPKAKGKLVAEINRRRRQKVEYVPVRN